MRWYKLKQKEAKKELKHILNNQKSVRISKLKVILQSMNISLKQNGKEERDREIEYLRGEIRNLNNYIRRNRK